MNNAQWPLPAMLDSCLTVLTPSPRIRTLDWACANCQTAEGRPYDHSAYPHIGAPGGPFDAFDYPQYLTVWLQWASRLGKTFCGQVAAMKNGHIDPQPMMFASADQKLAVEVTERTYRMLERSPPLRDQLRPKARRRQNCIDLDHCRCHVGWARSVSTLADKAVRFGHANEVDKWEHQTTSKEADPLKLFTDRFKEFPVHKKLIESTPAMKSTSRVERGRLASFNAHYWVPCPYCGEYQTLKMGDGTNPGGIVWEKNEAGKSDKDLARRTARYLCGHCKAGIRDEHRGPMMRAGVWVPEGCGVDATNARVAAKEWRTASGLWKGWKEASWITGTPLRDGRDAGYQLSSLYALSLTWGDIAAEFIECKQRPQHLRNFVNQWLAETWETREAKMTWEQLGRRVISDVPRFTVPMDCPVLVCTADVQQDRVPYVIEGWGENRRSHTVDYGECDDLDGLFDKMDRVYHSEDGRQMRVALTLIDSGYHAKDIYFFCREASRRGREAWPCKGSNQPLGSPYRQSVLGKDAMMPGAPIMHVDTLMTQDWISHQLTLNGAGKDIDNGAMTVFQGSLDEHQDFLEQLLNEACVQKLTPQNITKEVWERINENIPNDFRDCRRYSFAAMLRVTRGGEISRPAVVKRAERKPNRGGVTFLDREGGWIPKRSR